MRVLRQTMLMANSRQEAWYALRLIEIAGGFVIAAKAGSVGKAGKEELWFRWRLPEAEKLFLKITREKTRPGRQRTYHEACPFTPQLELFGGNDVDAQD